MAATSWREKRAALKEAGELERIKNGEEAEPIIVGCELHVRCGYAEEKETSKGGVRLVFGWDVEQPAEYAGRRVFTSHNVICPGSSKAEEIAVETLMRISLAAGLEDIVGEPGELLGRTVSARVEGHDHYNGQVREELGQWGESALTSTPETFSAPDDDTIPF